GTAGAVESPFGYMPRYNDLAWEGLDFKRGVFSSIMSINRDEAIKEAEDQKELFDRFGARLPRELDLQRQLLAARLATAPSNWASPH
ncbi:MAG: phosphoenolpyruvate carboxykinase (GTP), partial [Alphaproteobacteria bacterium]|nr:phosphoenolpyruvate carboxykinase (GTP) [Alphaproteobacteria bacterium]